MSEWITQQECADRLGITPRQVHNLAKGVGGQPGIPSRLKEGKRQYQWPEASHWYVARKIAEAKPEKAEDEKDAAQTRKIVAEAGLKERELAEREGTLIESTFLEQQVTGILQRLRSRIQTARGRYAPQFVGIKSAGEAQLRLDKVFDEFLESLREIGEDPTLDPDDDHLRAPREPGEPEGEG